MTLFGITLSRPVLALGTLAGLVLLVLGVTAVALADLYATQARLVDQQATLAAIDRRLAGGAKAESVEVGPAAAFVLGKTAAIAAAELQHNVTSQIADARGDVVSVKINLPENEKSRRIGLLVTFDIRTEGLQRVLYGVEAAEPLLLVDSLEVQATDTLVGDQEPLLRVVMDLSGVWRAP
jgi:general secretion pathway protein M